MMKVIEIQNFEAPELDVYARLPENQLSIVQTLQKGCLLQRVRR